jgi:small GTP-binding protein
MIKIMEIDEIETFKVLIVGNIAVGKTCFLLQFVEGKFPDSHLSTIGIDFKFKNLRLNDRIIKLQIWDTAGQDKYKSLTKNYFKGSDGVIVMYDITNPSSFNDSKVWINQIKDNIKSSIPIMLIANKIDQPQSPELSKSAGIDLAKIHGLSFFETSAKLNTNVTEAFIELARLLILNSGYNKKKRGLTLKEDGTSKSSKGCC